MSLPKLRSLDIRHHTQSGRHYLRLSDPQQISSKTLLVPQPLATVLAFCNGTLDAADMSRTFVQRYDLHLPLSAITDLLTTLDEALMLENERTTVARQAALAAWHAAPFRPPALAGSAYPANKQKLCQQIEAYSKAAPPTQAALVDWAEVEGRGIGLLSPHIDYQRGSAVYAQVWQRAAQAARQADLVIMLGTDHYGHDPFTLTRQHYATPYGVLPTATVIVDQLAEAIGPASAFAGELRHRGEHSLELPAVWLHHLRNGEPVETVPILVGGFHRFLPHNGEITAGPESNKQIAAVLQTLWAASANRRVLVLASGDLAHVGPAFGGERLNATTRARLRADDDVLIAQMQAGDAAGFWAAIRQVRDRNNVCGVAPIYLTLRLLQPTSGEPIGYATCPADEQNHSVVTVAGMVFQ